MEFNKKYIFYALIGLFFIITLFAFSKLDFSSSGYAVKDLIEKNPPIEDILIQDALIPTNANYSEYSVEGYSPDEILVSVKGVDMTLKQALEIRGLCGFTSFKTSYSKKQQPYIYADKLRVLIGDENKSLQSAVNAGELLKTVNYSVRCYDDDEYYYDSCNVRGNMKQNCSQIVPPCTDYGEWYCASASILERSKTCYTGSCPHLSNACSPKQYQEFQGDCGMGWTCETQFGGDDCYELWDEFSVRCIDFRDFLKDAVDCNNDFENPYTCDLKEDLNCTDYAFIKEKSGGDCETTHYLYKKREVKCRP